MQPFLTHGLLLRKSKKTLCFAIYQIIKTSTTATNIIHSFFDISNRANTAHNVEILLTTLYTGNLELGAEKESFVVNVQNI